MEPLGGGGGERFVGWLVVYTSTDPTYLHPTCIYYIDPGLARLLPQPYTRWEGGNLLPEGASSETQHILGSEGLPPHMT